MLRWNLEQGPLITLITSLCCVSPISASEQSELWAYPGWIESRFSASQLVDYEWANWLVGAWSGKAIAGDQESPQQQTFRMTDNGRYLVTELSRGSGPGSYTGLGVFGYDTEKNTSYGEWFGTLGDRNDGVGWRDGAKWIWNINRLGRKITRVITRLDDDHFTVETKIVHPDGRVTTTREEMERMRSDPEGVALEFIDALDNLDLERIMATQAVDATMFFPHPNATFRLENRENIRDGMAEAFAAGRARAQRAGVTEPPYLRLPAPEGMKVQQLGDDAAVVSWMFDRPGNFGRRSAAMRRTFDGWKMVNFHSSNLLEAEGYAGNRAQNLPGNLLTLEELYKALQEMDRPQSDRARDANRRPAEILAMSGIEKGDVVIDLYPGSGAYYSRILAGIVGAEGQVYGVTPPYVAEIAPETIKQAQELDSSLVNYVSLIEDFYQLELGEAADAIWMVNVYHDLARLEYDKKATSAHLYSLLKPGGTLLLIDHHGQAGSAQSDLDALHRSDAEATLRELEAAGFRLAMSSDLLANPDDDRSKSVFEPSIRGRTDRYIYVLRK